MADAILHAFNWHYTEVASQAAEIARAGYGAVLLPPPLYSDENGASWWQRYQPKDYRIIRSYLGGKAELVKAIEALHGEGVRVCADVVFNHMANEKAMRDDPFSFPGKEQLALYRSRRAEYERDRLYGNLDDGLFSPQDFNPYGDIQNWNDPYQATEHRMGGLPDLDVNDWVVGQQKECLRALNAMGFDGYRIDAVKHLPIEHIKSVFETPDMAGKFVFGESLTCNDEQERLFIWPMVHSTGISYYDFPLHEMLRSAFSPGGSMRCLVDPAGCGQALPWSRSVTFAVTHDIPNNDCFRGQLLDRQDEFLAKAYIFGRDGGVPMVFSDCNESAAGFENDRDRWCNAWKRDDIVNMIRFHNAVHGTPQRFLYEDDGFLVFARGERGIVAINKTGEWQHPRIWTYGLRHGSYRCGIHGHEMNVTGDVFEFAIPPRQAQMWLHEEA
jgi:alpha-amylase